MLNRRHLYIAYHHENRERLRRVCQVQLEQGISSFLQSLCHHGLSFLLAIVKGLFGQRHERRAIEGEVSINGEQDTAVQSKDLQSNHKGNG